MDEMQHPANKVSSKQSMHEAKRANGEICVGDAWAMRMARQLQHTSMGTISARRGGISTIVFVET
jgi:outer membrane lipoprotein SlyB